MKTNTNQANTPIWRTLKSKMKLTDELSSLNKLVYNLWWVWNKNALELFLELDPDLWAQCGRNPIILLQHISYERIQYILNDKILVNKLKSVISEFDNYMSSELDNTKPSVAYFSMEYGFTHILKIYSGGLGILAGDYLKEASDSRINMTGVGLLYRYGYFTQKVSPDGQQVVEYESQNFGELPIKQLLGEAGEPLVLTIPYPSREVHAYIWEVKIGRIKLYLLDTDNDINNDEDRHITHQLYGGDWENRIKQEYLLGIGGILLLKKLNIEKDIYHCNEGHAAFINLQRLIELIETNKLSFDEALEVVRASGLYTVHTPVPAGHDYFDEGLLKKFMYSYPERLGISWQEFMDMGREHPGSNEKFSMSVFALNTCQQANGVSLLHGRVSREMFKPLWPGYFAEEIHVGHVTNGVHMPTWTAPQMKKLYEETFGYNFYEDLSNHSVWEKIHQVPDEKLWEIRLKLKKNLLESIGEEIKNNCIKSHMPPKQVFSIIENFNSNALIVGFARRFATYKRAHLLFSNPERLSKILNNKERPIHFIFAGKAHPHDKAGQDLIKKVIEMSLSSEFPGKIIFLENYNMQLAQQLISGVDIWLNTPTRPLEASGTSGEKALMNGVLNFSVLDGWWYEGYKKNAGWCLTEEQAYEDTKYQDEIDASSIYYMFENTILPLYYAKSHKGFSTEWIKYIKNSIAQIAPEYTTKRMMDDYVRKYYNPLAIRKSAIVRNNFSKAKELAAWKEDTATHWDNITIEEINILDKDGNTVSGSPLLLNGEKISIHIVLDKGDLKGDLGIDFVMTKYDIQQQKNVFVSSIEIPKIEETGSKLHFNLNYEMTKSGDFNYSYRLFPKHPDMSHRMDFPYTRWI